MKPYRIKHVPTGLYYKPGNPNLSKRGKVYGLNVNVLSYIKENVICRIRINSPGHIALLKAECKIAWSTKKYGNEVVAYIPREQFEKEYL